MKLSRTAWNNVIIFSVMIFILLINVTHDTLFSDKTTKTDALHAVLPLHGVVVTMNIIISDKQKINFERVGRHWKLTTSGLLLNQTDQQIEQTMHAWQQSAGLIQATDIIIEGKQGIAVEIALAGDVNPYHFMLYPLHDQLLIYKQKDETWLALPVSLTKQLIPTSEEVYLDSI
jgi:cytochrome c oxidase assembly factor CtaG